MQYLSMIFAGVLSLALGALNTASAAPLTFEIAFEWYTNGIDSAGCDPECYSNFLAATGISGTLGPPRSPVYGQGKILLTVPKDAPGEDVEYWVIDKDEPYRGVAYRDALWTVAIGDWTWGFKNQLYLLSGTSPPGVDDGPYDYDWIGSGQTEYGEDRGTGLQITLCGDQVLRPDFSLKGLKQADLSSFRGCKISGWESGFSVLDTSPLGSEAEWRVGLYAESMRRVTGRVPEPGTLALLGLGLLGLGPYRRRH